MRDIENYEGLYSVTECGKVYSYKLGRYLKSPKNGYGYHMVGLNKNGVVETARLHRVVANAYLDRPEGTYEVNHIDGNKSNNDVSNLEWVTRQRNMKHASEQGLMRKVDDELATAIRLDFEEYKNKSYLARKYKLNRNTIRDVINRTGTYSE